MRPGRSVVHRCLIVVVIVLASSGFGVTGGVSRAGAETSQPLAVAIEWSMPPRFGPDADGDGLVDFPNTTEYAQNRVSHCSPCPTPRFTVNLRALPMEGMPVRSFVWRVSGGDLPSDLEFHRIGDTLDLRLAEGDYSVSVGAVVALPVGTFTVRAHTLLTVEDLLVVAIGDSYASGEGNPEVRRLGPEAPARWGDGGDEAATLAHAAAHRSTIAWPARTALSLERRDPHTSVTFLSVAASGARIDRGVLSPQEPGEVSQLDQLQRLVGERPIDLLLIQEGGNSVGFSRVVRALVEADPLFDPVCYHRLVDQAFASVRDGNWGRGTQVSFQFPFEWSCSETAVPGLQLPGLVGLGGAFERLEAGLDRFEIARVLVVGYPDPTGADADGRRCREIVGDVTPPIRFHEISREEGRRGVAEVVAPLNAELEAAAAALGWDFVAGVDTAFADGHGYCAPWPEYGLSAGEVAPPGFAANPLDFPDRWYRNPGAFSGPAQLGGTGITWYRTASQSAVLQGPAAPFATSGTLHPNEVGHGVISRLVLRRLGY